MQPLKVMSHRRSSACFMPFLSFVTSFVEMLSLNQRLPRSRTCCRACSTPERTAINIVIAPIARAHRAAPHTPAPCSCSSCSLLLMLVLSAPCSCSHCSLLALLTLALLTLTLPAPHSRCSLLLLLTLLPLLPALRSCSRCLLSRSCSLCSQLPLLAAPF